MHRPYWKFDEKLILHMERLRTAAIGGDHEASYIISKTLNIVIQVSKIKLLLKRSENKLQSLAIAGELWGVF
jgi:hypothetical protein